jgi:hypothetical protein
VYLPPLNKARSFHIMASLDGRPTIFAGSGNATGTGITAIEQFDQVRDRWHVLESIKLDYEITAAAGVGNIPLQLITKCQ